MDIVIDWLKLCYVLEINQQCPRHKLVRTRTMVLQQWPCALHSHLVPECDGLEKLWWLAEMDLISQVRIQEIHLKFAIWWVVFLPYWFQRKAVRILFLGFKFNNASTFFDACRQNQEYVSFLLKRGWSACKCRLCTGTQMTGLNKVFFPVIELMSRSNVVWKQRIHALKLVLAFIRS